MYTLPPLIFISINDYLLENDSLDEKIAETDSLDEEIANLSEQESGYLNLQFPVTCLDIIYIIIEILNFDIHSIYIVAAVITGNIRVN